MTNKSESKFHHEAHLVNSTAIDKEEFSFPGNQTLSMAVILPCYNEEKAIGQTVNDFRKALPTSRVYVYDNNSQDETVKEARVAGAIVRSETRQGKGNVVRRMFADIDADVYIMADGDATYDASAAPSMVRLLLDEGLDMVVGCRHDTVTKAYRLGHRFGNSMLTKTLALLFGRQFGDILSGYRVFSRRFVKTFPSLSEGFEIETEISVHALKMRMSISEIDTDYNARPEGSESKLNTIRDGIRILLQMITLFRQERPMAFFGLLAVLLGLTSVILSIPLLVTYAETGLVPRFPTAILCTGLIILSFLSITSGLILDTVTRGRLEMRRLYYLNYQMSNTTASQL